MLAFELLQAQGMTIIISYLVCVGADTGCSCKHWLDSSLG